MAACFAGADIKTIGVDINPASVEAVNAGLAPVEETGLAQYIAENKQNLSATLSYDDAVALPMRPLLLFRRQVRRMAALWLTPRKHSRRSAGL